MRVNTIQYKWDLRLYEEDVSINNNNTNVYKYYHKKEEVIKVNKKIQYLSYNIFESIYNLYCEELSIKNIYAYNIFNLLLNNKSYYIDYIDNNVVIPKVIYINQMAFQIKYLTKKEFKKIMSCKYTGFIVPAEFNIYVKNWNASKHSKFHTILHECIHGIFYTLGDYKRYNNEKNVELITTLLLHFIKNNENLLRLLLLANNNDIINYIENDSKELK